jgi:hypothetical protein
MVDGYRETNTLGYSATPAKAELPEQLRRQSSQGR